MTIRKIIEYVSDVTRQMRHDRNTPTFVLGKDGEPLYRAATGMVTHPTYTHKKDPLLQYPRVA